MEVSYQTHVVSGEAVAGTSGGVVFNNFFAPVINNTGQVAFNAVLSGSGVTNATDVGLFSDGAGSLELIAREGGPVPGLGAGVSFGFMSNAVPNLNDAGQLAFYNQVAGPGVSGGNDFTVFSETSGGLAVVARQGDTAPGIPSGPLLDGFSASPSLTPTFNRLGQAAFRATLDGPGVNSSNDEAIFAQRAGVLERVAREGDAVSILPGIQYGALGLDSPRMNNSGAVVFSSLLAGAGVQDANKRASFVQVGGSLRLVARGGDTVPGLPGVVFLGFVDMSGLNDGGQTAFRATLSGPGGTIGVFSEAGGTLALIARNEQAVPGLAGIEFTGIGVPYINNAGQTAFLSRLAGAGVGTSDDEAIFIDTAGSLEMIVREGDVLPGQPGIVVGDITGFAFNASGQVAFTTWVGGGPSSDQQRTLFATDPSGVLHVIARQGEQFDVDDDPLTEDLRTIASVDMVGGSAGADGRPSGLNDAGQVVFELDFTDGSSGVFIANVPEPASFALVSLGALVFSHRRR